MMEKREKIFFFPFPLSKSLLLHLQEMHWIQLLVANISFLGDVNCTGPGYVLCME